MELEVTAAKVKIIWMFFLVVLCCFLTQNSVALDITVDGVSGNDEADCLKGKGSCQTLDYTLSSLPDCRNIPIVILIQHGTYNYSLNASKAEYQIWNCLSISIAGVGSNSTVVNCNEPGAGFAFLHVLNVLIRNISFVNCGSRQNSTSYNPTTGSTSVANVGLYFTFCQNVEITECQVNSSYTTGVLMYNTHGDLNVINSRFIDNRISYNSSDGGGGGFYAEFCYCDPGTTDNCVQRLNSFAHYRFQNSMFSHNAASDGLEQNNTFIKANGTANIAFGRGGGLSLIFKGNASYNSIIIDNCSITNNNASWGAGLFIEFQDYSNHNNVSVRGTKINNNLCELNFVDNYGTGGGGARIGFIPFSSHSVQHNKIEFNGCTFDGNIAYWGGGLSYYASPETGGIGNATNELKFTDCKWNNNRGVLGSAVDLSVWHSVKYGVLSTVLFKSCEFFGHTNKPQNGHSTFYTDSTLGTGALYSDSIPLVFQGHVNFCNNDGSALALSAAGAEFMPGCQSDFVNNTGWTGGAVALLGNAWLQIYNNTNFTFYNNSAKLKGGAIYVTVSSRHDLLSSRNCFLQYFDQFVPPNDWITHLNFINNSAPIGSSIFATSLLSCVWGYSQGQEFNRPDIVPLNWTIIHINSGNERNEITSDIADISRSVPHGTLQAIPGDRVFLSLRFADDRLMPINLSRSVWVIPKSENVLVASNLTADYNITFLGSEYNSSVVTVVTDSPRIVSRDIRVSLLPCPPGYTLINSKCICAFGLHKSWDGITNCNDSLFQANLEVDYWAGYIPDHNRSISANGSILYTGKCPKYYCGSNRKILLPKSTKTSDLFNSICTPNNRTGVLCGECLKNCCVAINSRFYNCTAYDELSKHGLTVFLSSEFLPSTILLLFILFYDIDLYSGAIGSVILFFQVYTSLNIYSDGEIDVPDENLSRAINFLYNIWNLEYFGMWIPLYCLSQSHKALDVLVISYASGLYPFVFIFILYLILLCKRISICRSCAYYCIRLKWKLSLKASIVNGLVTFWTLAYTKLALVSCLILSMEFLNGQHGLHQPRKIVVSLQGTIGYFHMEHLPYAIPDLFILIVLIILPSITLLLYPLMPRIMSKVKNYVDLDSNKIYHYISGKMEMPFIHFKPLLDKFQGKYRPGCEFFAGLMFWYRLVVFLTYSFATHTLAFYVNSTSSLILVMLISLLQPFKKATNNTVLMLIVMNILI
ncbi:uncharacterized protein [Dysidea avara]|uniref:uncharacterized protein isoform X1 n=1 Tax=Dysidea avara TaxID=196820 RepID=UPI00331C7FF8